MKKPMSTALLDIRGLMLKAYHTGTDPEALQGTEKASINTAKYGIHSFIEYVLLPMLGEYGTPQIVAVWDGGNDRRRAIFPDYKFKRHLKDESADPLEKEQQELLQTMMKSLLASLGIIQVVSNTQEADDVIAKFCQTLEGTIEVFTVDGDLLVLSQNIDENDKCIMVNYRGEIVAEENKGLPHHLITLNKALVGDSSDEYKGVKGFGEKKWDNLVEDYGFDGCEELNICFVNNDFSVFEELDKDEINKALALVMNNLKDAKLCYELALLHPEWVNTPFGGKITNVTWFKRVPNKDRFMSILERCGGMDLQNHFEDCFPDYWLLDSSNFEKSDLEEFRIEANEGECIAFDYETFDPKPFEGYQEYRKDFVDVLNHEMTGVSFCFGKHYQNCFYMPTNHINSNNMDPSVAGEFLKQCEDSTAPLVAHSTQFEIEISKRCAGYCPPKIYDTQHIKTHVDEDGNNHLKTLSKSLMNYDQKSLKETIGDKNNMSELTANEAAFPYGCDDSVVTAHLFSLLRYQAMMDETWDHYEANSPHSEQTIVEARSHGINVDKEYLDEYRAQDKKDIEECVGKIHPLLEKHCTSANPEVVKRFLKEDFNVMLKTKNSSLDKSKRKSSEELQASIDKEFNSCLDLSIYVAPFEGSKEVKFIPTKTNLNKVFNALGIAEIDGVNKNKISNYLTKLNILIAEGLEVSEETQKLIQILGESCHQIMDRKGEDYDCLVKFCSSYMSEGKKIKTGTHLDTKSPKVMQRLLYCMLQLPVRRRSKVKFGTTRDKLKIKGAPSTDVDAINYAIIHDLEKGDWRVEVLECLKTIKTAITRESLYFNPYSMMMREVDGGHKLFPSIRLKGTVTRRPTGSAPNVLQISSIKDEGKMRKGFLPDLKGSRERVMVCIDFSQQELRIMASETGDETMQSCYIGSKNKDIHTQSAIGIYNKLYKGQLTYSDFKSALDDSDSGIHKIAKDIRKGKAKPTNFLVAYGGAHTTLSQRLMIEEDEAKSIFDAVFDTYPGIGTWQNSTAKKGRLTGYVKTAYGNKRHATQSLFSKDKAVSSRAERQLCNSQIQGCAADILDEVLAEYFRQNISMLTGSILLAPVYDEIVASVPIESVIPYVLKMVKIMEITPPNHAVPMVADVSLGWNWGEQMEIGESPKREAIEKGLSELLLIEN